ncbi:MAG: UDP-N-acetylmuramate--L-alanine ligase [Candidatus Babeliales bacterium]
MYKKRVKIHFMGIGGIGMSGIAEILRLKGYDVSGCDESSGNKTINHLRSMGCVVYHQHNKDHIKEADVLVYSSAIDHNCPEVQAALAKGIPVIPRAIMLAELMRTKYSIAVSGAHGKTTTTSLISYLLIEAKLNPTVVIGGILKNIDANAILGKGSVLVAEADESDRSLLYLNPSMAVVTNIDAEHLDTYKDLDDIKTTFKNFLARLPFYGKAFLCVEDPNVRSILPLHHISTVKYGLTDDADVVGRIIELYPTHSVFDVYRATTTLEASHRELRLLGRIVLNMPGKHNVLNALAAIAVCLEFEVSFKTITSSLANFKGIERRFEFKGTYKGVEIFDDYGHHPTEIKNTLIVAQKRAQKRLHVIFQPHRFTRTEKLWDDFVDLFAVADPSLYTIETLYLADIYPASEKPIEGITTERLIEAIKKKNPKINVHYGPSYDEITKHIQTVLSEGDLLLTVGAGKVNQIGEALVALQQ